jgi:N-acyl-phosphatidylethanolamine-hydrolysing phospholipase D
MDFFEKSTFRKGRFISFPEGRSKSLVNVIKWKWTGKPKAWPKWRQLPALHPHEEMDANQNSATWISHSTVLLKVNGQTILTDPVFSNRIGPFPWLGLTSSPP